MTLKDQTIYYSAETFSIVAVAGSFLGKLPTIALILGIAWYSVNLYDWVMHKVRHRKGSAGLEPDSYTILDDEPPELVEGHHHNH